MATKAKILTIILLTLFLVASYSDGADKWDKADMAWSVSLVTLRVIDWGQTLHIAANPTFYHEHNIILGKHPTRNQVNVYFPFLIASDILIAHYLPKSFKFTLLGDKFDIDCRRVFVVVNNASGIKTIIRNYTLGLGFWF